MYISSGKLIVRISALRNKAYSIKSDARKRGISVQGISAEIATYNKIIELIRRLEVDNAPIQD